MATQEGLEELIYVLYDSESYELFDTPIPVKFTPFRLAKLSLQISDENATQNYWDNLTAFVKLHKGTLEELELVRRFPNIFFKFIFTEFKQLKSLSLSSGSIPQDPSFYEQLPVNTNVIILKLFWEVDEGLLKKLLSRFPNIEKLTVFRCFRSALESLHIEALGGSINWGAFTKNNPGIKELSIGRGISTKFGLNTITKNLKQLRKLTVKDSNLSCDEKFFDTIRKNCHEMKSLELNTKSLKVDNASVADIPGLRFRDY